MIDAIGLDPVAPIVTATAGRHRGSAEFADRPGVRPAIERRMARLAGRELFGETARWAERPREGGTEWIAFSALESALASLAARVAGLRLVDRLGGSVPRIRAADPTILGGVPVLAAEAASFDEVVGRLTSEAVAAVLVDPRLWGVPAIARLDAVCRALQVGIALDGRGAGSGGAELARELGEALPMATLGVVR